MKKLPILCAIAGTLILAGCATDQDEYKVTERTSMANPAAVFCVQQDGELETVSESGQRMTYCLLPDGSRVEQWEYFRNNHDKNENSEK